MHDMYMECPCKNNNNKKIRLRKNCVDFLLVMTRTKRNPPIRLDVEGVVLGHDYITSYMNSKQRVIKVNLKTCR